MNYDFYDDMSMINGYMMNNQSNIELCNPYEGFLKGNAFRNEYVPYKDYKVMKVNINSEKEEMLFNIMEYSFMMHDLNLYLDVHPNDKLALNKFNEYRNKANELIRKYEREYGPFVVSESDTNETFNWVVKWPWVN